MKQEHTDNQHHLHSTDQTRGSDKIHNSEPDIKDQQIKDEPDTARLRSERQSVIDGEKDKERE